MASGSKPPTIDSRASLASSPTGSSGTAAPESNISFTKSGTGNPVSFGCFLTLDCLADLIVVSTLVVFSARLNVYYVPFFCALLAARASSSDTSTSSPISSLRTIAALVTRSFAAYTLGFSLKPSASAKLAEELVLP